MEGSGVAVPVTRADHHVREDDLDHGDSDAIVRPDTDRVPVLVDHQVSEMVTVGVHGPDPLDACGYGSGLTPGAARNLARPSSATADDAGGSEVPG